jgi:hypothetical protein
MGEGQSTGSDFRKILGEYCELLGEYSGIVSEYFWKSAAKFYALTGMA